MTLLEMSIAAGVMIGAVSIIRAVAMDRLPKKTFLALWSVVLLRLLAPVSLPSPTSLYNAVPAAAEVRHFAPAIPFHPANLEQAADAGMPAAEPLSLVWAVGALALAAFFLVSWVRCRRIFRESLPVEDSFAQAWLEARPLRRRVALRRSDRVSSPLTYGLLRPVILLPSALNWADRDRLEYVLSHEHYHIRRLDGLWKLLLTLALCLHWFNPLVWCMYVLANRDLELSCDESVVRSYGESVKAAYALTLIGMEEKRSMLTPLCNSFSKNAIEERVRAIMNQKKMTIAAICTAAVLVAAVTIVFATTAAKPEVQEPQASTTQGRSLSLVDSGKDADMTAETKAHNQGWYDWGDEEGMKPDPETGHYYTKKQYDQVAALKTEGYEKKSIAEFNRAIHAVLNEYENYNDSLMYAWEGLRSELPADDPLAPFVYYTLESSIDEYDTKLSAVLSGKEAEYEFDGRARRVEHGDVFGEQVEIGQADANFIIYYAILDQDKLTVGERDQFLMDIASGMQKYLEGLDLRQAIELEDEDLEKQFQTELDRLGKAETTSHISYTRGMIDSAYTYLYD